MTKKAAIFEGLKAKIGQTYGPSRSVIITQEMIDNFSKATLDPDPMHIDPIWSREKGPFDTTVSFGFLTMSLLTTLLHDLLPYEREGRIDATSYPLNYGFNKMRLITPVPVNSKVFATMTVKNVNERKPGQILQILDVTLNIDGYDTPALVGEWLAVLVVEGE